ncbi:MAG: hypothetical protein VX610_01280 [SAR324 cluster bacterium]|nr:hypothetical protein [SAR324 cluster bacterium]
MTIKGIYTGGVVQLLEQPDHLTEGSQVEVILTSGANQQPEAKAPWFPKPFLKTKGYRFNRVEANER